MNAKTIFKKVIGPVARVISFLVRKEVKLNRRCREVTRAIPAIARFVVAGFLIPIVNPWLLPLFMTKGFVLNVTIAVYILLLATYMFPSIPNFIEEKISDIKANGIHSNKNGKEFKNYFSGLVEKVKSFVAELIAAAKG